MIAISSLDNVKKVTKPWGYELWIECGEDAPYAMKILQINSGYRLSLQAHAVKTETMLILEGTGMLVYSNTDLDIDKWNAGGYDLSEIADLQDNVKGLQIAAGSVITIRPGEIHRFVANTDLRLVECSTNQLTDVIRIHDDNLRPSGHIDSEHAPATLKNGYAPWWPRGNI